MPTQPRATQHPSSYPLAVSSPAVEDLLQQPLVHMQLPVVPANERRGRRCPSPLFEPVSFAIGGNFQDILTYTSTDDSEEEALEIEEPIVTLNQTRGIRNFKHNSVRSKMSSRYARVADVDNRADAVDEAGASRACLPQTIPDVLDEDPNDNDYVESGQATDKPNQCTKIGRFTPILSDESDDKTKGPVKRKRQRYPLLANLEVDREKYDFRLPYYFSIRRSLRGRSWTRAPVTLGTSHNQTNSPLIRPLKAESIPRKQFHDEVKKTMRRSTKVSTNKRHGKYILLCGNLLFGFP
jgi:hypothetical protein